MFNWLRRMICPQAPISDNIHGLDNKTCHELIKYYEEKLKSADWSVRYHKKEHQKALLEWDSLLKTLTNLRGE